MISDFVGIPYALGQMGPEGSDCWSLVCLVFLRERGVELPFGYSQAVAGLRSPPSHYVAERLREEGARAWVKVPRERAEPFDVVMLRNLRPSDHVGLVSEDPELILTTDRAAGSHLCEWGLQSAWGKRMEGVYRYAGAP